MTVAALTEESWEHSARAGALLAGFWAEWCIPSRALQPLLESVARDFDGRVRVGLVDHDASPGLAERYKIQGLPTLLLLDRGTEVQRRVGLMDRVALYELLRQTLGS